MDISNSIVLVTGANRGVGLSLIKGLAKAGAKKIYATARKPFSIELTDSKTKIVYLALDVTEPTLVAAAAAQARDVNLVFNNAGVLEFGDLLETPEQSFRHIIETNFFGKLAIAKAFAPIIEANGGGAIVNTLTLLSLASMPSFAAYNASKAAAWSMTLSLRASLKDKNIQVINAFPGAIDTDMLAGVDIDKSSPDDVAKELLQAVIDNKEDVFPDPMSKQVYQAWAQDHKAVERQFASM